MHHGICTRGIFPACYIHMQIPPDQLCRSHVMQSHCGYFQVVVPLRVLCTVCIYCMQSSFYIATVAAEYSSYSSYSHYIIWDLSSWVEKSECDHDELVGYCTDCVSVSNVLVLVLVITLGDVWNWIGLVKNDAAGCSSVALNVSSCTSVLAADVSLLSVSTLALKENKGIDQKVT